MANDGDLADPPPRDTSSATPAPPPPWWERAKAAVEGFLHRQGDDLIRDAILGVFLAIIAFRLAASFEADQADKLAELDATRAEEQERIEAARAGMLLQLENTRFVRDISLRYPDEPKPLSGLYLVDAHLGKLNLSHADLSDADLTGAWLARANLQGANFRWATLSGATLARSNLTDTSLSNARLERADLLGAQFIRADLRYANLSFTDLREAILSDVDLTGSTLVGSNLEGARIELEGPQQFQRVCYNDTTTWPAAFTPPPPDCTNWVGPAGGEEPTPQPSPSSTGGTQRSR